jgi:zinc carboxypeptidase/immune inhibitor InhA-like protein
MVGADPAPMTPRSAKAVGSLLLAALLVLGAAPVQATPARAFYRISLTAVKDVRPLLALGLDVAGTGPGQTLDLILTDAERDRVRALGFDPIPIAMGPSVLAPQSPAINPNLGAYHNLSETMTEMASYASAHPSIAALDTIGSSLEGRPIVAIRISDQVGVDEGEPQVLFVGCHHAREMMSVELPLYVMRRLLDGYGVDPILTTLVNTRDIWIVPIVNPDGYLYLQSHTSGQSDSWWRKNRRPNPDGSFGVDLNRNYGYQWGFDDLGSSPTPSSEVYRGAGPFSEPETVVLRDFMDAHDFAISASFHSYGDLLLYPWGYDTLDTPDQPVFEAFGDSISLQNGYRAGNPKNGTIYLTNGEMDDWAYGDVSQKAKMYAFTFEVNSADDGGFAPPDAMIGPTCDLNWGPVLTLLRYADEPRRIVPPARPGTAWFVVAPPSAIDLLWSYPSPDPANPVVAHEILRIASLDQGPDDAESGFARWDSTGFSWSTARSASGQRSFYSGAGNMRTSILTARYAPDAAAGDSVVVLAYWDLEHDYDYWYADASYDGGLTWLSLHGDRTTFLDPFGMNEGNGITGTSGGAFARAAFFLPAGGQARVRFRCVTDGSNFGEGLYLDDITPTALESGATITATQSALDRWRIDPAPAAPTWFEIRGIDAENQRGAWSPRLRFDPGISAVPVATSSPLSRDRLGSNAPNPFNPRTEIPFALGAGRAGRYRLAIYDLAGRRIAVIAEGWDSGGGAGRRAIWDGNDAAGRPMGSGVYLVRLESVRGIHSRKVTLLR